MKKLISYSLMIVFLLTGAMNAHSHLIHRKPSKKSIAHTLPHPRTQTRTSKIKLQPIHKAWTAKVATLLGLPSAVASNPDLDLAEYAFNKKINFHNIQFNKLNTMLQNASLTFQQPARRSQASLSLKIGINFGDEVMPTNVFENMIKLIMCASITNADQVFLKRIRPALLHTQN